MKTYSVRVEVQLTCRDDGEAEQMVKRFLTELPRFEGSVVRDTSVMNTTTKKTWKVKQ